jgi:hypothetical protein
MSSDQFFTYYPERIIWSGLAILGSITGILFFLAGIPASESILRLNREERGKMTEKISEPIDFSLSASTKEEWLCPIPDLRRQIIFSWAPPRPDGTDQPLQLAVRLSPAAEPYFFAVPCQIGLCYQEGILMFAQNGFPFRLELSGKKECLMSTVFVEGRAGESFRIIPEESPIQLPQAFQEGSPFRFLSEGRWWGKDLFRQTYAGGQSVHRIELGPLLEAYLLDVQEDKWIAFQEGQWKPISSIAEAAASPIARIKVVNDAYLEFEGWEGNELRRISLSMLEPVLFKVKAEDLFGSIRIRSDKQISCILEKQCFILKAEDWVLKAGSRWKILRKAEEKEAFLQGKLIGELFVLDEISNKQGHKSISGRIYNLPRTQTAAIELPVLGRKSILDRRQNLADYKGRGR